MYYITMSQDLQLTRRQIFEELTKIVDPEIGVSIMELELIDKVDIDQGKVDVDLHLTSPFCPAVFGFKIAQDVKDNIHKVEGIKEVKVNESRPPTQSDQSTENTSQSSSSLSSNLDTKEEKKL